MPSGSGAGVPVTAKQGTRRREHPQESRAERSETPAPKDNKDDKTSYERDERKTKRTRAHSFQEGKVSRNKDGQQCQMLLKGQLRKGLRKCPWDFMAWGSLMMKQEYFRERTIVL